MRLADVFPSNFLKSEDLKDRDVSVVIALAEIQDIGNERKLVLTFQGKNKQMICNKTNAGRIAYMYGDETNDWVGKEIVLYSEFVEFQGRTVKGLRVKPPVKRASAATNGKPANPGYDILPPQVSSTPPHLVMKPPPKADDGLDDDIPF